VAIIGDGLEQMVADAGFTNQAAMEAMSQTEVDLIGALLRQNTMPVDRLKERGVSSEFYPQSFGYDESTDSYRCPAARRFIIKLRSGRPPR